MLKKTSFPSILFTTLITLFIIFFSQVDAQAITVQGKAYQDKGINLVADNTTVSLIANGTTSSVATSSTGYIINSVTAASGTTITVFINAASSTGVTVTRSGGSDISDLHIYQNHLIARSDDGSALTIDNMTAYDKSYSTSINMTFDTTGPTTGLIVDSGNEFYIWSGSTFSPAQSTSITISGSWTSSGTGGVFVANNGIVTFDGAGPQTITSVGSAFYNLTFSPSVSASYTLADDLEVDNDLTITSVILDANPAESNSINIEGNWTISGTGVFKARNGIVTFDDDAPNSRSITSGGSAFYNLTFNPSSSTTYTTYYLVDALDVDNALTITRGILDTQTAPSNTINVEGNWTNSGTFIPRNGTVTFDADQSGTHTITSGGDPFNNLTFSPSTSATFISYVLEDALDVDNDLTITAGILDTKSAESNTINVAGSWSNSGTFVANSGIVTFDGATPQTITSGGDIFYNLTFSPSTSVTFTLEDALDVNNDLTITSGILDTKSAESNSINVAGSWTNSVTSGTFTSRSGTVTFDGAQSCTITTGGSNWSSIVVTNSAGVTFADKFTCAKFTCITPSASLNFKHQETDEAFVITASGGLNLAGAVGQLISLRRYRGSGSNRWYINPSGGSWTVSYVNVKDSYNSHATYINPSDSTNGGNNYNWFAQVTTTTTTSSSATTTTAAATTTTAAATTTTASATTTTTTPTNTTTTQPFSCEVVITPSSETVGFEQTVQFSASTVCDDESVAGIYSWVVDSLIGSTIDEDDGLYKAGTEEGKDTVKATDIANDNVFNIATVTVGLSIEVSPSEVLRSRWIPGLALMSIKGSETNFELLKTIVSYDSTSVLPLPALLLPPEDIHQIILIIPSWFNNVWEDEPEVKVTVTTDPEVAVGSFDLKMLPEPLDDGKHMK